jgi:hypothetical protein
VQRIEIAADLGESAAFGVGDRSDLSPKVGGGDRGGWLEARGKNDFKSGFERHTCDLRLVRSDLSFVAIHDVILIDRVERQFLG